MPFGLLVGHFVYWNPAGYVKNVYLYDSKPGLARKPGNSVGEGGRGAVVSAYASHFATAFKDKKKSLINLTLLIILTDNISYFAT